MRKSDTYLISSKNIFDNFIIGEHQNDWFIKEIQNDWFIKEIQNNFMIKVMDKDEELFFYENDLVTFPLHKIYGRFIKT